MRTVAVVLLAIGLAWSPTLVAQGTGGAVRGRIVDDSGLPLPATAVVLTDAAGIAHQALTDPDGRFTIANLPAGAYTLTATFPGFRPVERTAIAVVAGRETTVEDVVLPLRGIEESVTVTALRREENVQDVPLSVAVLSGDTLRELGARDLRGITESAPNVEFSYAGNASGGGNFAQIFMRGVGQADFIITKDPGVGVYVDGVYLARAPGSVLELLDVDRVEIVRGPQGTLFGKNTIGGGIQVVTKRPTGNFGGEAQVAVGAYHRVDLGASVEFPIVQGRLAGRIAALSRSQDGYYKRIAYSEGPSNQFGADISQENGNDTGRQAGRLSLLWTPAKTMEVLFSGDVTRERQQATEYQAISLTTPANVELYQRVIGIPGGFQPYARYVPTEKWTTYATWPGYNNSDVRGGSVIATWNHSPVAIKSVTGYRKLFVQTKGDGDATPYNLVSTGGVDINQHQVSEELQFSGLAVDHRLNWVGGLWYFEEKARDVQRSRQFAGLYDVLAAAPFQSIAPAGNPNGACPAANCLGGGLANANDRAIARLSRTGERHMDNDSIAVFLHATLAITPRWSVTAGARQSRERKEFTYAEIYPLLPLPYTDPGTNRANDNPSFPRTTLSDSWTVFTPKLGVEFKPTENLLVYGTGSTGFKAGGFNGRPSPLTGLAPFGPERLKTMEAGVKSEWFRHRLRLNGSYYYSWYDDIQISRLSQTVAGVRVEENAGDGRSHGLELEIVASPFQGLTLSTALGTLDFHYTSLLPGVVPAAPAATGSISLDATLPFSPSLTVSSSAAFAHTLGSKWLFSVRGDFRHSAKYFIDPDNSFATAQPAYSTFDLRTAISPVAGKVELFIQGINLTNEAVIANGVTSAPNGSQIVTYKAPRQWVSGLQFRF